MTCSIPFVLQQRLPTLDCLDFVANVELSHTVPCTLEEILLRPVCLGKSDEISSLGGIAEPATVIVTFAKESSSFIETAIAGYRSFYRFMLMHNHHHINLSFHNCGQVKYIIEQITPAKAQLCHIHAVHSLICMHAQMAKEGLEYDTSKIIACHGSYVVFV